MQLTQPLYIILVIFFIIRGNDARRYNIRQYKSRQLLIGHLKKTFSTINITIIDTDDIWINYTPSHSKLCSALYSENTKNNVTEIYDLYMKYVYNNYNFPNTYRPNIVLNIDNSSIHVYMKRHCVKPKNNNNNTFLHLIEIVLLLLFYIIKINSKIIIYYAHLF